jgi:hypothetical protein
MKTILLLIGFVFASIHFADAQQSTKIPRIGYLTIASLSSNVAASTHSGKGCENMGTLRAKISSLSGDLERENSNVKVNSHPNWCVSM